MNTKAKVAAAALAFGLVTSIPAWAATSYSSFDNVVPKLGGMKALGYQTKATTSADGSVRVTQTGGGYGNYYHIFKGAFRTANPPYVYAGQTRTIPVGSPYYSAGSLVGLQAQSHNWTPVDVHVAGLWKSN